jgi:hypothetical protein
MRIDVITCDCETHLMRFELEDWEEEGCPQVYISLWEQGHNTDRKGSFWHRLKYAWREFRGTAVHDNISIGHKEKLVELRNIVNGLIKRWDDMEKKRKEKKA